ncbi:uncharacterized protein LOC135399880 [Ornithodoros turicata]|uniref:uncharacterized protein LOC135399880 n=1 Tax=Ornithodoros turicata TaxID=34597 RepID=UPI003139440A
MPASHVAMAFPARMLWQGVLLWCLLLPASLGFLEPGDVVSVARRQMETLPPHMAQPEPSCSQLRAMWRHMHRMARHSQVTNEIPRFPAAYPFGFVSPDTQPKVYYTSRSPVPQHSSFGKIIRKPNRSKGRLAAKAGYQDTGRREPVRAPPLGRFEDFPLPRESLGMFGTLVRSPEEKAKLQRKQPTGPYGSWGTISQEPRRMRPDAVAVESPNSRSQSLDRKQEWCRRNVLNQQCKTHQDCFCPRTKYFCSAGRCRASLVRKASDQWGSWYDGPLESTRLGARPVASSSLGFPISNNV